MMMMMMMMMMDIMIMIMTIKENETDAGRAARTVLIDVSLALENREQGAERSTRGKRKMGY